MCLFVFNRLDHVRRTVKALLENPESVDTDLIVFADAARRPNEVSHVEDVRSYVRGITGFRSVRVEERAKNFGLARSIIDGVTQVVNEYGNVIVLEDDIVSSPHFLRYMNEALELYAHEPRVASIHAYIYPIDDLPETFFLKGADCWGWATWKDRWSIFNPNGRELLEQLKARNAEREFDFDGSYPYTRMLIDQIEGRNNSWAIRWHASAYLAEMVTLYPGRSLVANIGNDASGTHCDATDEYDVQLATEPLRLEKRGAEPDSAARAKLVRYFRGRTESRAARVRRALSKALRELKWLARMLLPPILLRVIRGFRPRTDVLWRGDFKCWNEALSSSTGYDDGAILRKVEQSTDRVVTGQALYERDSVTFQHVEYSWPMLSGLLWSTSIHGSLNVLDFGGSLGSSYRQNRSFLREVPHCWNVVEQPGFVELGRRKYQDQRLRFYESVDRCLSEQPVNTFFCSSTLQYLPDPNQFLKDLVRRRIPVLIFDRVSIIESDQHRLTVQTVPEQIYRASYPCWFFSERRLLAILETEYELLARFDAFVLNETWIDGQVRSTDRGYILRLRKSRA